MESMRTMRLPTCEEWDRLVEITGGDDGTMHWNGMFSWCNDVDLKYPARRAYRGYDLARRWYYDLPSDRHANVGFRPVIDLPNALEADGSKIVMGTLYMDGQPVQVPQRLTWNGDVTDYILGAKLELRSALADPAYQMVGIKVGSIAIADRVMLKEISWDDIRAAVQREQMLMRLLTCEEWDQLVEITGKRDERMHWEGMYSWCDDVDPKQPTYRTCCGYYFAYDRSHDLAFARYITLGFRPVLDILAPDDLVPDGSKAVMGTLYMGGQPIKVPQRPTWAGDIMDYVPGSKLELRLALPDPAYQMEGIKVAGMLVADRAMIKNISWEDIQTAIDPEPSQGKALEIQMLTNEEWDQIVEATDGADEMMHWQGMYSWCDAPSFRGFLSADHESIGDPACRTDSIGFRPVISASSDDLAMGTLYMDGQPVPVPKHPTWDGDITAYIPGAKLELRPSSGRPKYQIHGIRVGDLLVADRVMLKQISLEDIEAATKGRGCASP